MLVKLNNAASAVIKTTEFACEENKEFITGSFTLVNFGGGSITYDKYYSNPIIVEGFIYRLVVYPFGHGDGKDHFLSLGLNRQWLDCNNLDYCDKVTFKVKMLNKLTIADVEEKFTNKVFERSDNKS